MMIEKHVFCSRATQRKERSRPLSPTVIPISPDMLPIKLRLFNLIGCVSIGGARRFVYAGRPDLVTETQMSVPLSRVKLSYRIKRGYRKVMAGHLSRMGVPEDEHLAIIAKIFEVVDEAVPRLPITVVVVDATVRTAQNVSLSRSQVTIHGSTWELMETYRNVDPIVSYYHAVYEALKTLECVSVDSLEGATRQTPCFICKESLDRFVAAQGQGSEDHREEKIARLPCSHLYHKSCIVLWLLTRHWCPLCRHPFVDEISPKFLGQDMMLAMCSSAPGDTFVEKIIMKAKLWESQLRKKISKSGPFLFLIFFFSVVVGYNLLLA